MTGPTYQTNGKAEKWQCHWMWQGKGNERQGNQPDAHATTAGTRNEPRTHRREMGLGLRAGKWCMDFLTPLIVCAIAGSMWLHSQCHMKPHRTVAPGWFFGRTHWGFQRRNQRRMWGALDEGRTDGPSRGPNMCSKCVYSTLIIKIDFCPHANYPISALWIMWEN